MEDYRAILKRNREKQGLSQNKLAKRQFFRICKELQIKVFPDEP